MKVCIRQTLTVAANRSSGDQYSARPPNSGGLEVARSGLPLAEITPARPVFQVTLLRNRNTLWVRRVSMGPPCSVAVGTPILARVRPREKCQGFPVPLSF